MGLRIAIPLPTSIDQSYNGRSLPPYCEALLSSGAMPVEIPLGADQADAARILAETDGILLPGSKFDIDPERYGEARMPECNPSDPRRAAVDELLLQDAFNLRKPILAICHGMQTLNVWRNGALIQDLKTAVNHSPGRTIAEAHPVKLAADSRLLRLSGTPAAETVQVNSSHHQAVRAAGDGFRVTAVSPADGVIEAVELDRADHFVVGVQWHPERTYAQSPFSQAIFRAFVQAVAQWSEQNGGESGR